jgi:hypothetical protein
MPEEEPLNLVPIMNLVTILIPVLLMAIKSLELAIIDTTLPAQGGAAAPPDPNVKPPLALKMVVTKKGIRLLNADEYLYPSGRPAATGDAIPDIPCISNGVCTGLEDYNWPVLSQTLFDIKEKAKKDNRDSDNVGVVSENNIRYEILVGAMEASRDFTPKGGTLTPLFPVIQIGGSITAGN